MKIEHKTKNSERERSLLLHLSSPCLS